MGGGSSARWDWRRAIAARAREIRRSEALAAVPSETAFEVEVRLFLTPRRALGADLDNLVRPVVNTLFESRDEQADRTLTAALFSAEDARIYRLVVEKRAVEEPAEEGVDVLVRWDEEDGSGRAE